MTPRRVVIVEEDPGLSENLAELLRLRRWAVARIDGPARALEFLSAGPVPDALVLDLELRSAMSAAQFVRSLRADPRLEAVPVLVLAPTGWAAGDFGAAATQA